MGRKAKSVEDSAAVVDTMAAIVSETVKDENEKEMKKVSSSSLEDYDEIEVMSLIPNVSYKDSRTGDMYEWDEVGHVEIMTFETLKNMWRNNKGYFRNMCLKPNDDRVINKFGLTKTYEKFEFLMDESNYTRNKVKEVCSTISETPNGLKYSIVNKIKDLVVSGAINDIVVIRELEKHLGIEIVSLLQ